MTWQEGNLMSIQTSGNNKDQGSATFTYTEYPNPWVGIDVGAIALPDLEEVNMLIGSCGITTKNLPASRTEGEELSTYEYTFDGEGRVSTIVITRTEGTDRFECTYTLHYGPASVPPRPDYITYLTKQEIVDEGRCPTRSTRKPRTSTPTVSMPTPPMRPSAAPSPTEPSTSRPNTAP